LNFERLLSIEKHRTGSVAQDILGGAAQDHFNDAPVAVSADEEQIVIHAYQIFDNFLFFQLARAINRYEYRLDFV